MPRIEPLKREDLAQYDDMFQHLEEFFGYLPNDYQTMARKPGLLEVVAQLTETCLFSEHCKLPMDLRMMICYVSSRAAGCQYCTAHSAELTSRFGVSLEKVQNVMDYENQDFTDAEKAALRIAHGANQFPNAVTDADFDEARKHFSDEEIVDIVSLISMMSVYNKWNDTMATSLEKPPAAFSQDSLAEGGWKLGKHAAS